jgi:hypothetical protein
VIDRVDTSLDRDLAEEPSLVDLLDEVRAVGATRIVYARFAGGIEYDERPSVGDRGIARARLAPGFR